MTPFWIGLLLVLLTCWDVYEGRSAFFVNGHRFLRVRFERAAHPLGFWVLITLQFVGAALCFLLAAFG